MKRRAKLPRFTGNCGKLPAQRRQEPQEQFSRYLYRPAAAIRTSRGNSVTGIGPLLRGFGSLLAFFQPSPREAGAETFLARRIGGFPPLTTDRAIVEPAQRPPEAPDGTFRVWVLDVGYRLCSHYVTRASRLHRKHRRLAAILGATRRTVAEGSAARTAAEPTRRSFRAGGRARCGSSALAKPS